MSSSFFINIVIKIYNAISNSYEQSVTYKLVNKFINYCKRSLIISLVINFITCDKLLKLKRSSFIINLIENIFTFISKCLSAVFKFLDSVKNTSFTINTVQIFTERTKNIGAFAKSFCYLGIGFSVTSFIVFGFSKTSLLVFGLMFITCLILGLTDEQHLDKSIKKSIIYRLIVWFFCTDHIRS